MCFPTDDYKSMKQLTEYTKMSEMKEVKNVGKFISDTIAERDELWNGYFGSNSRFNKSRQR